MDEYWSRCVESSEFFEIEGNIFGSDRFIIGAGIPPALCRRMRATDHFSAVFISQTIAGSESSSGMLGPRSRSPT